VKWNIFAEFKLPSWSMGQVKHLHIDTMKVCMAFGSLETK